jgi:hypothetical protein
MLQLFELGLIFFCLLVVSLLVSIVGVVLLVIAGLLWSVRRRLLLLLAGLEDGQVFR